MINGPEVFKKYVWFQDLGFARKSRYTTCNNVPIFGESTLRQILLQDKLAAIELNH